MEEHAPTLAAGEQVGRYRLLRAIGTGAMGEVFLAIDDSLGRRAAIKLLGLKHLADATVRERFLREARALANLNHPNLITVYESGFVGTQQRPYFAMELLEGGDTEKLMLEQGPLPGGVVALIGAQAAAGLGEAARAKIIHRDVKPANLGISAHGVLKVTDFSLAKSHAIEKHLTARGFVVGTADYIAPEQARGEPLDERADVYALGCTLHHLLTGRPPYRSSGKTEVKQYVEIMQAHISAPVPDAREIIPGVDEELARLIRSTMDKDRERRSTFEELAPALLRINRRVGGQLPRLTRPLFTLPTGTATIRTVDDSGASHEELELPRRRSPLVITALIALLAAAAVMFALIRQ